MHPIDGQGMLKAQLYSCYVTHTLNTLVSAILMVSSTLRFRYNHALPRRAVAKHGQA